MLRIFNARFMSEFKPEFAKFAADAFFTKPEFIKLAINAFFTKPEFIKLPINALFTKSEFGKLSIDAVFFKSEHGGGTIKVEHKFFCLFRAILFSARPAKNREPRGGGWVAPDKRDFRARKSVLGEYFARGLGD